MSTTKTIDDSKVRIGDIDVDEDRCLKDLEMIRRSIEAWAKRLHLWHDAGFHVPYVHRDERPQYGDVLYLWFEGPLYRVFSSCDDEMADEYQKQFTDLLNSYGFGWGCEDNISLSIYPESDERKEEYLRVYRWQWVKWLLNRRMIDIHDEVFEHFAHYPDYLRSLSWRNFEEFLDAVFRNQGFFTELGSGGNDGGVDLRLYQSESIPELVTLVQAKKYSRRPVKLEAVAALFGAAVMEKASRGILATTSYFQPKAKKFALSTQKRLDVPSIDLVDSARVGEWCAEISRGLTAFYSSGDDAPPILKNIAPTDLLGKIVVASGGYNITRNYFAIIEADFPYEVILRPIGSRTVSGDSQVGYEIPAMDRRAKWLCEDKILAFKKFYGDTFDVSFWGGRKLFHLWSGEKMWFNYMD